jgi:polyphosphate glucokinase
VTDQTTRRILTIDIGGSKVKALTDERGLADVRRARSGPDMGPAELVARVQELVSDWSFDVVSVGFPGPVAGGVVVKEPRNLGPGWVGFDFAAALGRPVRVVNDAAMQALGSYEGGKMLFLGLGTGLGSACVADGHLLPLELAHLPYRRDESYEDWLGTDGLRKRGKRRWREALAEVCALLRAALVADYVVLGGGNVRHVRELPPHCRRGDNSLAFEGGFRLWRGMGSTTPAGAPVADGAC